MIQIRVDLLEVEDVARGLLEMSETLSDIRSVFKELISRQRVEEINDPKFEAMAEELSSIGVRTAITLSDALARINDPEYYPHVSDFVRDIREYRDAWVERDSVLLNKCRVYAAMTGIDCLANAVKTHQFVLQLLKDMDPALEAIENTDQYRRETGKARAESLP